MHEQERALAERTAKWLVGDRLSCVLHLGDGPIAYLLAEQGHEVVVAGDDVVAARHPDIQYVRTQGDRLPFVSDAFDVVVAADIRESHTALAEFARVLHSDGLLSTMSRTEDESIPWMRKLREIVGQRVTDTQAADTFTASGLFRELQTHEVGEWEQLDLPGLLKFAEATKHPTVGSEALTQVRELFQSYAAQTGFLRLRRTTHCLRARVDKTELAQETPPPDTVLLEFT